MQNALKFATLEDKNKLSEQIEKNLPNITDAKIKQKWLSLLKKKSLGDTKGVFKSGESDGSETSSMKGGAGSRKTGGGPGSEYSGRSGLSKKSSGGGNQGPSMAPGMMPPP